MDRRVCIIGAGPAGLMAAIHSAAGGAETTVIESGKTAGRKLLLTGAGRCNLTHDESAKDFIRSFGRGGRFLSFCVHEFGPGEVRRFFGERGLGTKVEAGGCAFPDSERAGDVRALLESEARKSGARFLWGKAVESVDHIGDGFRVHAGGGIVPAGRVVIATGGVSWPRTGSRGDGYRFAKAFGHRIVEPRACLVPLVTAGSLCGQLAGTSVGDVKIWAEADGRKSAVRGALMFTDDGIGGPAVLDLSRMLTDRLAAEGKAVVVCIDLLPAIGEAELEREILAKFAENPKRNVASILGTLVPKRLASSICGGVGCEKTVGAECGKGTRRQLIGALKGLGVSVTRTRRIGEATVTRGGVSRDEIDPKTMESTICSGLFFAGEVIDVDGPCGGYNLQACWSTGALAGKSAAAE
ncbi:MAG: NAD(P)/FAD-dependent oxidoreductase [Sedimentisphaerales bacterium]|nr:NAD(P)/FAD-dependent oxidoreductase [Sedimentisphaerales bacterium]